MFPTDDQLVRTAVRVEPAGHEASVLGPRGAGKFAAMPAILLVEDDVTHRRALSLGLTGRNYDVIEAASGAEARRVVEASRPDLVLLDLGLPDIDGIDLCRHLHAWPAAPIIVVSGDADDQRMLAAFEVGADDYVVKPVAMDVLVARINVHLRHAARAAQVFDDRVDELGDVRIDYDAHLVEVAGEPVDLGAQQFTILSILMRHAGRLVTHDVLAKATGNGAEPADRNAVRVQVSRLRGALGTGEARPQIVNERHVGYRLEGPD
jgi:two-component system KDP operon response regulator KdpE